MSGFLPSVEMTGVLSGFLPSVEMTGGVVIQHPFGFAQGKLREGSLDPGFEQNFRDNQA